MKILANVGYIFPQFLNLIIHIDPDSKLLSLDGGAKNSSDDEMGIGSGCSGKRDLKEIIKVNTLLSIVINDIHDIY